MMLSILLDHKIVKIASFSFKGKKVVLSKLGQINFSKDVFDAQNVQATVQELKNFFAANHLKPAKTVFCLAHQDIVSRQLILPLLPRREVEAIIVNEIEKAPRFANNPYVYTYQLHEYPFDRNTKVVYYVFQKSLLQTAEKILGQSGCSPVAFDIYPLSILNALAGKKQEQALVYVDDKLSHLMVCRGAECRANYLFNIGAHDLQGIGLSQEGSVRNFARDIASLLKTFYDNEKAAKMPIAFLGEYPPTNDFFKQMSTLTGYDCAPFVFDKNEVVLPNNQALEESVRKYASVVGSIFRMQKKNHYFNIFKLWDLKKTPKFLRIFWAKRLLIVAVLALLGLSFLGPKEKEVRTLKAEQDTLAQRYDDVQKVTLDLQVKRQTLENLKKDLFRQARVVHQIRSRSWMDLFDSFNDNIPADVWLQNVSYDKRENISLKGVALNLDSVAELIRRLKKDARFTDVKLGSTSETKVQGTVVYEFVVDLKFSLTNTEKM